MRVVFWGTYDTGKPRVRILLSGLRENGIEVVECHREVWQGVEDKSQVKGLLGRAKLLVRWLLAYPPLVLRYLRLPAHDAVVIGYLGQLDVLVIWPLARLRGVPIVWDAFLSLYNTVVEDRQLISPRNPLAWVLWGWEWLACRAADIIVVDTNAHGRYFVEAIRAPEAKIRRVYVGAETGVFEARPVAIHRPPQPFTVLFYGQFIPLHGIETVVRAAKLTEHSGIRWIIVGTGQEAPRIKELLESLHPTNVERLEWIPYANLLDWMYRADVCLGIFGATAKAARVIPNKVFQILAANRPLITGDTPAIRELLSPGAGCVLVPVADPVALATAVVDASAAGVQERRSYREQITPRIVARALIDALETIRKKSPLPS